MGQKAGNLMAFLMHPRYQFKEDLSLTRKLGWVKIFSEKFLAKVLPRMEPIPSRIWHYGKLIGYAILIPMTGAQILARPKDAIGKIASAIFKAKILGAKIVALGAYTSSITNGGQFCRKGRYNVSGLAIDNGNDLTARANVKAVEKICAQLDWDMSQKTIAIIGATGSTGRAVSMGLAFSGCNLILISRTMQKLQKLKEEILDDNFAPDARVSVALDKEQNPRTKELLARADMVIVLTTAVGSLLDPEDLKQNAIIYDPSQPQNTTPELLKSRLDVTRIDGCVIRIPGIKTEFEIGLNKECVYACFAKGLAAAHLGENHDSIGDIEYCAMLRAEKYFHMDGMILELAPFTSFGKPVDLTRLSQSG